MRHRSNHRHVDGYAGARRTMRRAAAVVWLTAAAAGAWAAGTAEAGAAEPYSGPHADTYAEPGIVSSELKSPEALEDLVGPVALYPDDLLSVVLPASVYPLQIVQAARFLEDVEDNPELTPRDDWDESVIALLNYPDVVRQLSDDLDWTWELGQAVLNQQEELIAAVSRFREAAHGAGNLRSDERQRVVIADAGVIEIHPANPQVIYVPRYEPSYVRVYHSSPVVHYYPRAYPVYYYPYPADHYFASGYFWGVTSAFSIGWYTQRVHLHLHQHHAHPYFGRPYYPGYRYWTPRRPIVHHHYHYYSAPRHHQTSYWRPREHRLGPRPGYRHPTWSGYRQDYAQPQWPANQATQPRHSLRPDQTQWADRGQRPDYAQRPDRGQRPDANQRPDREQRPDYAQRPDRGQRPDANQRPDRGQRPDHAQRPEQAQRPVPQWRDHAQPTDGAWTERAQRSYQQHRANPGQPPPRASGEQRAERSQAPQRAERGDSAGRALNQHGGALNQRGGALNQRPQQAFAAVPGQRPQRAAAPRPEMVSPAPAARAQQQAASPAARAHPRAQKERGDDIAPRAAGRAESSGSAAPSRRQDGVERRMSQRAATQRH